MTIACAGVTVEYVRRSINDSAKEARRQERIANIEKQISEYQTISSAQATYMLQLEQIVQNQKLPSSLPKKTS
jgi:hypothetical protein